MKAKTHYLNGANHFTVSFMYEDYYGGETFSSFDEMQKKGNPYPPEGKCGTLVGILKSYYWGSSERIDILPLDKRPTISQIKAFMKSCHDCISDDARVVTGEELRRLRG